MQPRRLLIHSAVVLATAFTVPFAAAEEGKSGRLSDGRAYRTDQSGFKISDHIAELEVQVTDLQRQVINLESELVEKDKLLGQRGAATPKALPVASAPVSCDQQTAPLQRTITDLEKRLSDATAKSAARERSLQEEIAARDKRTLQEANARLFQETEGNQLRTDIEQIQSAKRSLEQRIAALESDLAEKTQQVQQQQARLQQQSEESGALRNQIASLQEAAAAASQQRTQVAAAPAEPVAARARMQAAAPVTRPANVRAAEPKEIATKLSRIQNLISQRKDLLDALQHRGKIVSVEARRLVAKDGRSLDALRAQARQAQDPDELGMIAHDLDEIAGILNEDITLLKRLGHL